MPTDTATRALLIAILACLLILVVQGVTRCGQGRYQVTTLGSEAPILIRVDTKTGALWKLESSDAANRWVPIAAPEEARGVPRMSPQASGSPRAATSESDAPARTPKDLPATGPASATRRGPAAPPTEEEIQLFVDALLSLEEAVGAEIRPGSTGGGI